MRETTALGAAIAAGFAVGVWKSFDELKKVNTEGQTVFEPKMDAKVSKKMFAKWERAVTMSKGWLAEEAEEKGDVEEAKEIEEHMHGSGEEMKKVDSKLA